MFLDNFIPFAGRQYLLSATGIKFRTKTFLNREEAKQAMYDFMAKHKLVLSKIYDDKHYKTYVCRDGIRFYINRNY